MSAPPFPLHVHMLSSLPPPYGGVNIWTQWFLAQAPRYGLRVTLDAIGAKSVADTLRLTSRLGRLVRGFTKPLWSMTVGRARYAAVLHLCSSGGASFWRSLVLATVRGAQGGHSVLHLHSSAATCGTAALAWAAHLVHTRRVLLVTPSRRDADTHAFMRAVDHFVPDDFGGGCAWQGVKAGPLRLVYVGWMIRGKGLFELAAALRAAPDVTLDAFGPDVQPAHLAAWQVYARQHGLADRMRYRGVLPHDAVAQAVCGYDALILPSHAETFGFAAAEAMHVGVPVIAPRVGFLWEAPTAVFVGLDEVEPVGTAAVLRELQGRKERLVEVGARGRAYVRERLTAARVMPLWKGIYEDLTG